VLTFALRRAVLGLLMLAIIATLVFVAFRFVPGDIVNKQLEEAGAVTPQLLAEKRAQLGLDDPMHVQFARWAKGVLTGDLGNSLWSKRPVSEEISRAIVPTLQLSILSIIMGAALGILSGAGAALTRGGSIDFSLRVGSTIFLAIPHLWLGLLVLTFLAWIGYFIPLPYRPFLSNPLVNLQQVLIPAAVMALGVAAALARLTRSAMLEVVGSDYVRAGHARGLSNREVYFSHGLKNALIPVLTMLGIQFSHLLSGTVIIERIFNVPGLGSLLFDSVSNRDYTLIQAIVIVYGLITIIVNLAVDLSYGLVDPRIRDARS
jgi:peptide/nickel transport system permease protein